MWRTFAEEGTGAMSSDPGLIDLITGCRRPYAGAPPLCENMLCSNLAATAVVSGREVRTVCAHCVALIERDPFGEPTWADREATGEPNIAAMPPGMRRRYAEAQVELAARIQEEMEELAEACRVATARAGAALATSIVREVAP